MKAGTLTKIVNESLTAVIEEIVDPLTDEFKSPTPQQDAKLAGRIVEIFEKHGVDVDDRVQRGIQSFPLFLGFFGQA